ncbi:MAG: ABC transporter [Sulfobacillus acidophilus]|uniref:ABC transporter n=1 Tax=Sulfobacillus acidophilus TaxID=53633 RepID=A0A2T2WEM9_9FIRM|nr:MAG: ABC transporter [Sulfobacillus acidophilus]
MGDVRKDRGPKSVKLSRGSWARLREIAEVLAHHGLLWMLDGLGLSGHLSWGRRIRAKKLPAPDANWPERVRLVLAALGPTYVKLGQLASMRPDVLPAPLVRALARLQDDVPPFAYQEVVEIVEQAWGTSLAEHLAWFDPTPLAAASIGQVHRARLLDGRAVVIKVRRPGIVDRSESDFRILRALAERAERRHAWARKSALLDLVDELVAAMRDELDFTVEARNTDTGRKNLARDQHVMVPKVIWPLTYGDVLVLESLAGLKISEVPYQAHLPATRQQLARRFVHSLYRQIFVFGFFHADPHPGNVHIDDQGRLIFLDWGLVGTLSREMRSRSIQLVLGLVKGQADLVAEALLAMGSVSPSANHRNLIRDIERLRHRYYESELRNFQLGQALTDLFNVAQRHEVRIPAEYMLLAKVAVIADGVVRGLDPEFSLVEMGKPWAVELMWERINPAHSVSAATTALSHWAENLLRVPDELERALATLSRGEIHIVLEQKNIDGILGHWEKLINRVVLSLLVGAVVLGLALIVRLHNVTRISVSGYGFLVVLVLVLAGGMAVGVLRRRRL